MSDSANSENVKDPHAALASLWPSDSEESKKLAEQKQQKRQNLIDLGSQFKQAREALGYNISELDEHTGLSFTELEAIEQGLFQQIEQQDYADYYVHTYAALLGLDADQTLSNFKQNYYQTEAAPNIGLDSELDIHDKTQYEDAFADEAKQTLDALEASSVNMLQATANQINPQDSNSSTSQTTETADLIASQSAEPNLGGQTDNTLENPKFTEGEEGFGELQATHDHQPITSDRAAFPWFKLSLSFAFVLLAAFVVYLINNQFNFISPNSENGDQISTLDSVTPTGKDENRVPETQKAKKVAALDSKIIAQGSDDLNAPTADANQKPLVLMGQQAISDVAKSLDEAAKPLAEAKDSINNAIKSVIEDGQKAAETITETAKQAAENIVKTATGEAATGDAVEISDDLAAAKELAAAAAAEKAAALAVQEEAAKQAAAEASAKTLPEDSSAQLPEDPIQEALALLPSDTNKYSLHATQNNWVLIEDDAAQILFSGELTPEKIITLPKVAGVIISLGDAGVIEVYKGKTLLGLLGEKDESLDLVSVEQRFNQITN